MLGAGAFIALGGECLDVHVEYFREAEQDPGRHRPLVALEMVEVGRGNAELRRHRALL
jgi:hypothetical protein